MMVPLEALPPTTVVGLMSTLVTLVGGGGACGVKLRVADQAPGVPAVLTPRTRQNMRRGGEPAGDVVRRR